MFVNMLVDGRLVLLAKSVALESTQGLLPAGRQVFTAGTSQAGDCNRTSSASSVPASATSATCTCSRSRNTGWSRSSWVITQRAGVYRAENAFIPLDAATRKQFSVRSEGRRVGKGGFSTFRSRWPRFHKKKKKINTNLNTKNN